MSKIGGKLYEIGLYLCILVLMTDYIERTGYFITYLFFMLYVAGALWRDLK